MSFILVVPCCVSVVSSRVIVEHIMWMRRRLGSQVIVTNSHRLDSFLECFVLTTWYTQSGVLEVTVESHCASGKLIVERNGRSGGRGKPLAQYVVKWKLMHVC